MLKKKFCAVLLACCMIMSIMPVANAAGDAFKVSTTSCAAGEVVTVTFTQPETISTMSAVVLKVSFDNTVFTATSVSFASVSGCDTPTAPTAAEATAAGYVELALNSSSGDGDVTLSKGTVLLTLVLEANADASAGSYTIKVDDYSVAGEYDEETFEMKNVTPDEAVVGSLTSSVTVPCTNHAVGEDGSEATCLAKAKCGTCGAEFGDVDPTNHVGTLSETADPEYLKDEATCKAAATYWKSYSCCGAASDEEYFSSGEPNPHDWSEEIEDAEHLKQSAADCQSHNEYWYDCANCDAISDEEYFTGEAVGEHKPSSDWTTKNGKHFHACTVEGCTVVFDEDDCTAEADDGDCTTAVLCSVCEAEMIPAKADHEAKADDGDCTTAVTCKYCDHVFVEAKTHVAKADDGDCTTAVGCANEGCEEVMTPAADKHVAGEDDGDCTTPIKCENEGCEQNAVAAKEHDFTGNYDSEDPARHWHICNNEGCAVTDTEEAHSGGTATCKVKAKCEKCGQTYGTFGPCVDNNTDGQCDVCKEDMCDHVIEHVDATPETCTTAGNIAHYKCSECNRLYANEDGTGRMDEDDVVIKAIAHKNAAKQKEVAATCVAAGVKAHFVCPDCDGKYLTKTIDAVDQSDEDLAIAIDPDAHKWGKGVVTVEPTVDAEGLKVYTCAHNPEHKKEEILPKKNPVSNITPSNPEGEEPAEPVLPFTDVKKSDWFYNDVVFAYENGLMNGTGNNKFSPAVTTDRAMIVTVLWRLEGSPVVDSAVKFIDVETGAWYAAAIDWASANGIVNGYGDGKFGPTAQITREQIMAILNRYAVYKGWAEDTAVSMVAQYTCSVWAENNVNWADLSGLLADLGVDVTDMTAMASRAELAAYLSRFMENIAK